MMKLSESHYTLGKTKLVSRRKGDRVLKFTTNKNCAQLTPHREGKHFGFRARTIRKKTSKSEVDSACERHRSDGKLILL